MDLPFFHWMRETGWSHFDHFVYCNVNHSLATGRGKKRQRSGNYYKTEENGLVVVRAHVNVHTHVIACRDCVWNIYQQEVKSGRYKYTPGATGGTRNEDPGYTADPESE